MTIYIAGTGPVSPIGIGKEEFLSSLVSGRSGIGISDRYQSLCGEVASSSVDALLKDRRFRRAAPFSRFALLSVKLALEDAGFGSIAGPATALSMATMHGASNYTQEFHRAIVTEGVEGASPILFSDSVLNAAAGNLSLCYGIKGPAHTLIGATTASFKAVQLGCELLMQDEADTVVVASSEELNEIEIFCYSRLGISPLAEGGGALILARDRNGSSAQECRIRSAASCCNPADTRAAVRQAIRASLADAELHASAIDLMIADMSSEYCGLPVLPAASVTSLTGMAFSASAAWQITAAVQFLRSGKVPPPVLCGPAPQRELTRILLCAGDAGGVASAMVIEKG